jgi:hypothetical protein
MGNGLKLPEQIRRGLAASLGHTIGYAFKPARVGQGPPRGRHRASHGVRVAVNGLDPPLDERANLSLAVFWRSRRFVIFHTMSSALSNRQYPLSYTNGGMGLAKQLGERQSSLPFAAGSQPGSSAAWSTETSGSPAEVDLSAARSACSMRWSHFENGL